MCGIFGFFGSRPVELLEKCLHTLSHRGPDGYGIWQDERVFFGHRRLAIIDTTDGGKQPMSYANGRYWITFNGEIYNFCELKSQLEKLGYGFKSDSDTEVLLAAFCEYGEDVVHKLNGMWALAIYDRNEKRIFLSRDRFGKKPLFYSILPDGGFAFASEMKAILPLMKGIRVNRGLFKDIPSILNYETEDNCLFDGIHRIPAGHSAWFDGVDLKTTRYWCTLDHLPEIPTTYEDQVEAFRDLFLDACKIRMRSDVPIGTALSGGLDSSATICSMSEIAKRGQAWKAGSHWQHAFCASFPGTPLDEVHYAKIVADHIGLGLNTVEIDPTELMGGLSKDLYLCEEIFLTSPLPFVKTYSEVKKGGISVTIDGHGADEAFGGYSFDYIQGLDNSLCDIQSDSQILDTFYQSYPKNSKQFAGLPPKWLFWGKWKLKSLAKSILGRKASLNCIDSNHHIWKQLSHLDKLLYVSTHKSVLPTLLRNYDRYGMAASVEIRMPFMDYRVICFAFALNWKAKIRNGFSKAIVRDALSPFMPHEIAYRRTKIGFNSPIVDWIRGPMKEFFQDHVDSRSFKDCDLIEPKKIRSELNHILSNENSQFADGERLWVGFVPYLWQEAFKEYGVNCA